MVTSRGAFFLGLSLIICVAMVIYGPQIGKMRYLTIPTNQGVFILDTKTQMMNLCTEKSCKVVPQAGGFIMPGGAPTYGQFAPAPVNSLGIVENDMLPNQFLQNCQNYRGCNYGYAPMQQQVQQPQQMVPMAPPARANPMMEERAYAPVQQQVAPARYVNNRVPNDLSALQAEERAMGI